MEALGEFEQKPTKETKGVVCHNRPEAGVGSVQPAVFSRKTEGLSRSHGEHGGLAAADFVARDALIPQSVL